MSEYYVIILFSIRIHALLLKISDMIQIYFTRFNKFNVYEKV